MIKATLLRLERRLVPKPDGVVHTLVAMREPPEGLRCEVCGGVHADLPEAERIHGGVGVLLVVERVVDSPGKK